MEEDEEKSDDTADYYGSRLSRNRTEESWKVYGGFMANMADIENKARELAELIILTANIWTNPLIFNNSVDECSRKFMVFRQMMQGLGLDIVDAIVTALNISYSFVPMKNPGGMFFGLRV